MSVPADEKLLYKEYARRFQNLVTDATRAANYDENTCVIGNGLIHETPTLVEKSHYRRASGKYRLTPSVVPPTLRETVDAVEKQTQLFKRTRFAVI